MPVAAEDVAAPLDPDAASALEFPLSVSVVASALPVLPVDAEDCAEPPLPPPPPWTFEVASPLEPDAALALELLPVAVTSMARASPVLPDCDWAHDGEAVCELPGATPASPAWAVPVSPDTASADADPMGATDSAVARPELPD